MYKISQNRFLRKIPLIFSAAALAGLLLEPFTHSSASAQGDTYKVVTVENGGAVTGAVSFANNYPKRARIKVSRDNETCGGIKLSEKFLVSKETKGLKNVLVAVEGITAGKAPSPSQSVTLKQDQCTYVPHFQVAEIGPGGVDVVLLNEDGIFHNVHAFHGDKTLFNVPHMGETHELRQKVTEAGVVSVRCDVHDWMSANVVLLKNQPYYSVTDENGKFSIGDIPPGTYTLRAWHEALGTMEKEITITGGETTSADFIIKGRSKKKKN